MSKITTSVLTIAVFLGISAVSYQHYKQAKFKAAQVGQQFSEIEYLQENLSLQIKDNDALEEENFLLEEQLKGTKDSLAIVNKKYDDLAIKYQTQHKSQKQLKHRLAKLKQRYQELNEAKRIPVSTSNTAEISQLRKEKHALLQEMLALRKKLMGKNDQTEETSVEKTVMLNSNGEVNVKQASLNEALFQTKVIMKSFSLQKRRYGKVLSRIGKKNDWKYTVIKFDLEHTMPSLLTNQNFKLKIIDSQTGKVQSYVESNPNFPNSSLDSRGLGFQYTGEQMELVYFNAGMKTGKDYHLAFYLVDDKGQEQVLPGAYFPLVKKGKVLSSK